MIGQNIRRVEDLTRQVKGHAMCLQFTEDRAVYLVRFPEGYRIDGVRVSKGLGKIKALEILLEKMELYWNGGP